MEENKCAHVNYKPWCGPWRPHELNLGGALGPGDQCLGRSCNTMQLFMWQRDIVGVAHYIKDCFGVLGDDASTSSSSGLAAG